MRHPIVVASAVALLVCGSLGVFLLLKPRPKPPAADVLDPVAGGKDQPAWVEDLKSPDYAKVRTAQLVIASVGPDARPAADALLQSGVLSPDPKDDERRRAFTKAVRGIGPAALPTYLAALAHDSDVVRQSAIIAIQQLDVADADLAAGLLKAFDAHAGKWLKLWELAPLVEKFKAPNELVAGRVMALMKANPQFGLLVGGGFGKIADRTSAEAAKCLLDAPQDRRGLRDPKIDALRSFGAVVVPLILERATKYPDPQFTRPIVYLPRDASAVSAVPAMAAMAAGKYANGYALEFLKDMGPLAKDAIPALRDRLRPDPPPPAGQVQMWSDPPERLKVLGPLVAMGADPKELLPLAVAAVKGDVLSYENVLHLSHLGPVAKDTLRRGLEGNVGPSRPTIKKGFDGIRERVQALLAWQRVEPDSLDLFAAALKAVDHRYSMGHEFGTLFPLLDKFPRDAVADALRKRLSDRTGEPLVRAIVLLKYEPTNAEAANLLAQATPHSRRDNPAYDGFEALAGLGEAGVPYLIQLTKRPERDVRAAADYHLRKLGPTAKAAADTVKARLADPDPKVRSDAALLLHAIDPTAKDAMPVILNLFRPENRDLLLSGKLDPSYSNFMQRGYHTARKLADVLFDLDPKAATDADVNGVAWAVPAPPFKPAVIHDLVPNF